MAAPRWSSTARRRRMSRRACASATSSIRVSPLAGADGATRHSVAFFALLYDQDLKTRIEAFARDEAGNEAKATFVDNVFEKPFKRSRIEIDDSFINRTVPDILDALAGAEDVRTERQTCMAEFLKVNGELRRVERRPDCGVRQTDVADEAVEGPVRAARQLEGRGRLRRPPDVHLQGQGGRPAGAPRLRPRGDGACAGGRGQRRHRAERQLARHLRQLRHHRPRAGRAVAVRASAVVRREGRRQGDTRADDRAQRFDRAGRRRPPALHDAGGRAHGEPGRMVGSALDAGSGRPEAQRCGRRR